MPLGPKDKQQNPADKIGKGFANQVYNDLKSALAKVKADTNNKGSNGLAISIPKAEKKTNSLAKSVSDEGPKGTGVQSTGPLLDMKGKIKLTAASEELKPLSERIKDQTKVDKDYELSLRYKMPKALQNIDNKQLMNLSQWISQQIYHIEQERSVFMDRLLRYRQLWLDFVAAGMQPIWEGAHDIHIPVIFSKIKIMHSRIYQAILGITPPFSLKPKNVVTEKQKNEKEQLLANFIQEKANYGRGWEDVVDRDIWNFCADGTSITKQSWARDVRKYTDVKEVFKGFEQGEPVYDEVEEEREEVVFDGPIIKTVNIEDFYIAGINTDNPDEADILAERCFYTKSDLVKLAQQGYFFKEPIEKVLTEAPMNLNQIQSLDFTNFKSQERDLAGVIKENSGHKVYEIFEAYCRWDIDQDGIDEELVVWWHKQSGLILRMTYLERACPGAVRPFTIKRFINRQGSPFGIGLAEMLYGISNELDYIHNQRLDNGTIRNLPFGFVRASAGNKPKEIKLAPGTLYPLDNPREDVYFPTMNGGTAYGFQEEAQVTNYGNELSGLSGFNAGSLNQQGATRTATGAAALVAEVNTNLDIHIKRFQRGYKRNLMILDKQLQELLPLGDIIRMLGPDGKEILMQFENRKAIKFDSEFELTANSVSSNKAVERDTANLLLQILQNPMALQAGLITPVNLYNVYRNFLQKAEIKDVDAYITKPAEISDSPYTAKDELTMILGGIKPPIYIKDRHEEKLAFFDQFENSDEFSWFTADHLEIYRTTKKAHMDMMGAIQAQMPMQGVNTNGGMQNMTSQLAAGMGAPQGVPQQQADLLAESSPAGGGPKTPPGVL